MSDPTTPDDDTPLRRRTRGAIVDAAVHVWARDWAAPLSTVATQAGVSRSTLHRYFVDRPALVDACLRTAWDVLGGDDTCEDHGPPPVLATTDSGSVLEQLAEQLEGVVTLGEWVLFLWTDPSRFEGNPLAKDLVDGEDHATRDLIARGQETGELDPDAPVDWLLGVYYSVLYCAAELVVRGTMTAREAGRLGARTLRHGITAS